MDYVRAHDSPFFSIRYYGDQLPEFLAAHEDYAAAPVLAELARWEWTMTCVFDAADAAPLAHTELAQHRRRSAGHGCASSGTRACTGSSSPGTCRSCGRRSATTPRGRPPRCRPASWLLWRRELATYFRSLSAAEAAALDAARSGWPFAELCELLCEEVGEAQAPAQAAELLRGWLAAGLIVGTS